MTSPLLLDLLHCLCITYVGYHFHLFNFLSSLSYITSTVCYPMLSPTITALILCILFTVINSMITSTRGASLFSFAYHCYKSTSLTSITLEWGRNIWPHCKTHISNFDPFWKHWILKLQTLSPFIAFFATIFLPPEILCLSLSRSSLIGMPVITRCYHLLSFIRVSPNIFLSFTFFLQTLSFFSAFFFFVLLLYILLTSFHLSKS